MTKVVIIAGGKGTRLQHIAKDIPKPMVPINGRPILQYQIELARRYGYTDIIILTGHLGEQIEEYFGNGERFGVSITYSREPKPLGTAGCIKEIEHLLSDDFFVFYGDTVMDIALDEMYAFHERSNASATLFLHPNDHPYDSDLADIDDSGKITAFYPKPHHGEDLRNLVNAALYILSPAVLRHIEPGVSSDFGKHIFPKAIATGDALYGYVSSEYIKDMGTPDRYERVSNDVISGKVASWNKHNTRPAVFLDRDGVLSREMNLLAEPSGMQLLPRAAEAVHCINRSGYLAVVVTNQPVIARNLCSFEDLRRIHDRMETLLGAEHAYIDALYFCPHHPDKGYPEERKEYKIDCECRKPKPGMLLQAAKDLNIDLAKSFIIGDRESDIQAGRNAGLKGTILVKSNGEQFLSDGTSADKRTDSLYTAVTEVLGLKEK